MLNKLGEIRKHSDKNIDSFVTHPFQHFPCLLSDLVFTFMGGLISLDQHAFQGVSLLVA